MPGKYIDFEEVKAEKTIEDAVALLGLELKNRNGQLRGPCPVCGDESERIFVVTPAKDRWYCFACQNGGDQIAMVAKVKGIGMRDAAFELVGRQPEESKNESPAPERGFRPLDYLKPDHEAVEALGMDPKAAEKIGCGYAPRGLMRGMVAIPVRLPDGTLVGYIGVTECKLPPEWNF